MRVNNIKNSETFGTKCLVGDLSAEFGLKKYNQNLSAGIYQAFKKLSKNRHKDTISIIMGPISRKQINVDELNISYFDTFQKYKSSININALEMENLNAKQIKKTILLIYDKLKIANKKAKNIISLPFLDKSNKSDKNKYLQKIIKEFGSDDSSLLY